MTDKTVEQRAVCIKHTGWKGAKYGKRPLFIDECRDCRAEDWCAKNGFHTGDAYCGYQAAAADTKRRALECVPDRCVGDITANPYMDSPCEPDDHAEFCPRAIRAEIEKRL